MFEQNNSQTGNVYVPMSWDRTQIRTFNQQIVYVTLNKRPVSTNITQTYRDVCCRRYSQLNFSQCLPGYQPLGSCRAFSVSDQMRPWKERA